MEHEIFVDTSGLYALLVRQDDRHEVACALFDKAAKAGTRFVTTDYVLDETATLLKARRHVKLLAMLFSVLRDSRACRLEWMDLERFGEVEQYFLKHADQEWSFTDCASFVVMRRLRLRAALTKDAHFRAAGFQPLLA